MLLRKRSVTQRVKRIIQQKKKKKKDWMRTCSRKMQNEERGSHFKSSTFLISAFTMGDIKITRQREAAGGSLSEGWTQRFMASWGESSQPCLSHSAELPAIGITLPRPSPDKLWIYLGFKLPTCCTGRWLCNSVLNQTPSRQEPPSDAFTLHAKGHCEYSQISFCTHFL